MHLIELVEVAIILSIASKVNVHRCHHRFFLVSLFSSIVVFMQKAKLHVDVNNTRALCIERRLRLQNH